MNFFLLSHLFMFVAQCSCFQFELLTRNKKKIKMFLNTFLLFEFSRLKNTNTHKHTKNFESKTVKGKWAHIFPLCLTSYLHMHRV